MALFFARLAVKEHVLPGLPVRPLVAELFLTDNCNLKCVSCACWRSTTRSELDTAEWQDVLDQLADLGIRKANFTGGEPLLRRDAPQLMAYAWQRGIRNLHLNTNAVLLDARRREAVLEAGVRSVNVSVDGPDAESHEAVRGVAGSFDRTVEHLQELVAVRSALDLRLRMNFTVMRRTIAELPRMMRFAQEVRVPLYLNLATDHTFLFRDGQVAVEARVPDRQVDAALAEVEQVLRRDPRFLPRPAELQYLRRHFDDVLQRGLPCAESQLKLMVRSRGEVGGCWAHDGTANVRTTRLADLLDSAAHREQGDRLFRKECVGCGSNYALNLRWRPGSYVDDVRWRAHRTTLARAA